MTTLRADIEVARPAGEVFAYLSNLEHNVQWQGGMRECRITSPPPLRVGSTYEQVAAFLGRRITSSFEVTALESGRSVTIETRRSTFPIKVTRTVTPLGEGRSRVEALIEGGPGGVLRLLSLLLDPLAQRSVTKDYQRLKALLEGGAG